MKKLATMPTQPKWQNYWTRIPIPQHDSRPHGRERPGQEDPRYYRPPSGLGSHDSREKKNVVSTKGSLVLFEKLTSCFTKEEMAKFDTYSTN